MTFFFLMGETFGQLTEGVGAKSNLNSTFIYLYSLGAEIWFKKNIIIYKILVICQEKAGVLI
jgi:hypothetical protein